jgi:hypothetical protein
MRKLVLAAAVATLAAGCSGGSPTVQGSINDAMITSKASCGPANALQVALTNASGQIIARDNSAAKSWTGSACVVPFSFTNVPQLATYGIRVVGLGGGTVWLTPAQVGQSVKLRIEAGFALSGS